MGRSRMVEHHFRRRGLHGLRILWRAEPAADAIQVLSERERMYWYRRRGRLLHAAYGTKHAHIRVARSNAGCHRSEHNVNAGNRLGDRLSQGNKRRDRIAVCLGCHYAKMPLHDKPGCVENELHSKISDQRCSGRGGNQVHGSKRGEWTSVRRHNWRKRVDAGLFEHLRPELSINRVFR